MVLKIAFWIVVAIVIYLNWAPAYYFGVIGKIKMDNLSTGFTPPWWSYPGFGFTSLLICVSVLASFRWKTASVISLLVVGVVQAFFVWLYSYKGLVMPSLYLFFTVSLAVITHTLSNKTNAKAGNA